MNESEGHQMTNKSLILKESFWNLLGYLDQLVVPIAVEDLLEEIQIDNNTFMEFVAFTNKLQYNLQLEMIDDVQYIRPCEQKINIQIDMSFSEWIAMQAHFPKLTEESDKPYHDLLANKLGEVEAEYPHHDLFKVLQEDESREQIFSNIEPKFQEIFHIIENSLKNNCTVELFFNDGRQIDFYPHRILFLDGSLSVVGEESNDKCLVYFLIDDLEKAKAIIDSNYVATYTSIEINDFITQVRLVGGQEERLVLKIKAYEELDLSPAYHYLGTPYMTANSDGDVIWAASVEVSEELFEWLLSIKGHIEILDPTSFKMEFLEFCERKLADNEKIAA